LQIALCDAGSDLITLPASEGSMGNAPRLSPGAFDHSASGRWLTADQKRQNCAFDAASAGFLVGHDLAAD
jgi:hypothetical protein